MNVFEIIKNQMIEAENEKTKTENKVKSSFLNGATITVNHDGYFNEYLHKTNNSWDYVLKCLISSNYNYSIS